MQQGGQFDIEPNVVVNRTVEIVLDIVMLIGIAMLVWHALYVAGFLPQSPSFLFKPWEPASAIPDWRMVQDSGKAAMPMLLYVLALVALLEYPFYKWFIYPSLKEKQQHLPNGMLTMLRIHLMNSLSVWFYILIIYFVQK